MTKPSPPSYTFSQPFCAIGSKAQIPAAATASGRASLDQGFPTETQLPMSQGGVAPNRLDFNGLLWALSAYAFWQQSGGQFSWTAALGYVRPALVHHDGRLWWCLADNGPDEPIGTVEPGTNDEVWQEFLIALVDQVKTGGGGDVTNLFGGNPVGTVIMYYGTTAPDGYLACDGSSFSPTDYPKLRAVLGSAITPDLRGHFVRGLGGSAAALGVSQPDAGRNLTGAFEGGDDMAVGYSNGCFYVSGNWGGNSGGGPGQEKTVTIDASRQWGPTHTASEFRPLNKALLFCVKHD